MDTIVLFGEPETDKEIGVVEDFEGSHEEGSTPIPPDEERSLPPEEALSQPEDDTDDSEPEDWSDDFFGDANDGEPESSEVSEHEGEDSDEALDDLFLSAEDSEGEVVLSSVNEESAADAVTHEQWTALQEEKDRFEQERAAWAEQREEHRKECSRLEQAVEAEKAKTLRLNADLENFRRRTTRDKEVLAKYGGEKIVTDLLAVVDNLERALQHGETKSQDQSIIEGVRMVFRQFVHSLERHGVRGFESVGEQFDPQKHEAVQQIESPDHDTGEILEQFQKGYTFHDRLIRPAMVVVAKNVVSTVIDDEVVEADSEAAEDSVAGASNDAVEVSEAASSETSEAQSEESDSTEDPPEIPASESSETESLFETAGDDESESSVDEDGQNV